VYLVPLIKMYTKCQAWPMQLQISAAQPDLSAENLPSLETLLLFELPLFVLQLGNLITLTLLYLP